MRRIIIIFAVLAVLTCSFSACGNEGSAKLEKSTAQTAQQTKENTSAQQKTKAGRLDVKDIPAPSLQNNIIGEPTTQGITVYLPASYENSGKNYPVVYFLPGFGDDYKAYGDAFAPAMDRLITSGKAKDMIVVTVNGRTAAGGSFYNNSSVTGNWEDFVVKDVVNYVDSNYRTIKDANSRGISGHSMGGFGAINIAMHHPEMFSSLYAMSPGLFDKTGLSESPFAPNDTYLDQIESAASSGQLINDIVNAYGMAFAPDPKGKAPYMLFPYKKVNGKVMLDNNILKLWENGFGGIDQKIEQYKDNLKKFKAITIEYGENDEYPWIPRGCEYFSKKLTDAGIVNKLVTFEGDHQTLAISRYEEFVLPFFSQQLTFQ
ncbi:MAG: alpha/beta hydrolase-fold protein [Bacillota bacterium]|nr:alpha/beta hydrolase-fold protein [Bacillota bacterium]